MKRLLRLKALLICLVLTCSVSARGETLTVGGVGAQFHAIQDAVNAARSGDTVEIRAGTYVGDITLNKTLTLKGLDQPVMRGSGRGSVIDVVASGCTLQGLIIEHSGNDLTREDSGILLRSNDNWIEGNELRDVLFGIYLYGSRGNTLRRNRIRGRVELEIGERGAGLHLWNSHSNTIENNNIADARDGMYIQSCTDNRIRNNTVSNLRYGLHYMNSDGNVFEDNYFSNNVAGAAIMYSRRIELRRNAFVHNRGFSSFGILFQDCDDLLVEENFIIDNETGIFMEALRKTTFRRNVIAENDVALQIFSSSDKNLFTENNFVANLTPLRLIGKSSTDMWTENGRGNFWSNYDGYDLDGNGIGDIRHKVQNVFEYMEGEHPRLRIYLNSPAAQALALAEKSFPILKGSPISDPSPLIEPVTLRYPFASEQHTGRARLVLFCMSLSMFLFAALVIWRGRRRIDERFIGMSIIRRPQQ